MSLPERPRLVEPNRVNKGLFIEIQFPPLTGLSINNVPEILNQLKSRLPSNIHPVRMLCSVQNPQMFGLFNTTYGEHIGNHPPSRYTTIGESPVAIGAIVVQPNPEVKRFIVEPTPSTKDAPPAAGPYSQGMRVLATSYNEAALTVYTSGQMDLKPGTTTPEFVGGSLEEQTIRTMKNVNAILKAGGTNIEDLTDLHIVVTSEADKETIQNLFKTKLPEVKLDIQVGKLVIPGGLIEIAAEATKRL